VLVILGLAAGFIAKGWVVGLIPLVLIFFAIVGRKGIVSTIDSFFSLAFLGGIIVILFQIGRSILA